MFSSKSRFTTFATKAVVTKMPMIDMIDNIWTITYGAFLLTAPIDPPIVTLSVVMAKKMRMQKIAIEIQTIGCRSWNRSSNLRISENIDRPSLADRYAAISPARLSVEK